MVHLAQQAVKVSCCSCSNSSVRTPRFVFMVSSGSLALALGAGAKQRPFDLTSCPLEPGRAVCLGGHRSAVRHHPVLGHHFALRHHSPGAAFTQVITATVMVPALSRSSVGSFIRTRASMLQNAQRSETTTSCPAADSAPCSARVKAPLRLLGSGWASMMKMRTVLSPPGQKFISQMPKGFARRDSRARKHLRRGPAPKATARPRADAPPSSPDRQRSG